MQCSYPSSTASAGVGVTTGAPLTSSTPVITAETIQLHAVQFWDPDGTRALIADRGSIGGGLAIGFGLIAFGSWMWGCALIAVTVLTASYLSTIYRLSKWRASSGIEQQALFNDMYEIVEQTCTDTRRMSPPRPGQVTPTASFNVNAWDDDETVADGGVPKLR
ncbi:Hypothetical Protein FCC1311_061942 [Hondaea fermentalgiana]|uniref:Uncharacterized protein n=1 Tax=Hondaea fermentalgiana TaxID=2315210 RepID=A0A2R5GQ11_9STRA|nr:Hypothetical Protein FCC1311_061942 [Hondaea fermentalgiana]|eukprot:GBG29974.1 Hypothetical Protein FCC1311_061942 [Hondaea fermentalgiana]